MRYNILIILILCLMRVGFTQQILVDKSYHFSFLLPPEWSCQPSDSVQSFIRFKCFNLDSSAMVALYAIKAENSINLSKFSSFVTSEEILGKSLGQFQDSTKISINKVDGIQKNYRIKMRRGAQIDVQAVMLIKENYGYIIITRCFNNVKHPEALKQIMESFNVKFPRSTLSWMLLLGFIGVCLYGLGLGTIRIFKWFEPLNWRAIVHCAGITLLCLVSLSLIYLFFQKINILISLTAGGLLLWVITKLPDASPVIAEYNKVKMKNTAGAYRAFCQQYQSSIRYYQDARQKMNAMMDEVVRKYKNLVAKLDTPIVQAALTMFEYIKKTDNFEVAVKYHAQNQIHDFTEQAKRERNWTVLPASPAFTTDKNREREESITALINYAFRQIMPEDILSFSTVSKLVPEQINFQITYVISTSGTLYCYTKENDLPDDKKNWFTGVEFKWLLEIRIPGQKEIYQITLESTPAQHFSTKGEGTEKVYDAMADSAFHDFSRVFIEQSGLMSAVKADIERREKAAVV